MSPKLEVGTVIGGRYQLEGLLGQGGMATVWEARHLMTRRLVAMKFLHAALDARPEMRRRFLREAQAAAAVDHPNVVTVHDVFQLDDGMLVLVMARLEGETLAAKLAMDAPLSLEETVTVLLPVVSAVGSAHARGVIHRDLKPENVFLSEESGSIVVRVLDFGIAKLAQNEEAGVLTTTGTVLGTPCYMAPEQAYAEKSVDHRADIWSIGAMLYEALSGTRPIEGDSLGQVVKHMLTQGITPIFVVAPGLPNDVARLITRMLCIEPEGRPGDLREVHAALSRYARSTAPSFGPPVSSETQRVSRNEEQLRLLPEKRRTQARLAQAETEATAKEGRLAQPRRTESWKPLIVGSPNTTGAHTVAITPRSGRRRLLLLLGACSAALLLIAIWRLRSQPRRDPVESHAATSYSVPLPVTSPTAHAAEQTPQAPLAAAAPATSEPAAPPGARVQQQPPKPVHNPPLGRAASAASAPANPPAAPKAIASSAPRSNTGLQEAVPF
jgi:serine/threonine protein kinase